MLRFISRAKSFVNARTLQQTKVILNQQNILCRGYGHTRPVPWTKSALGYYMKKQNFVVSDKMKRIGWGLSGIVIVVSMITIDKSCLLLAAIPLLLLNGRDIYVIIKCLPRDIIFLRRYLKSLHLVNQITTHNWTVPALFKRTVQSNPNKVMMQIEGQDWKYKEVSSYANRVTRLCQKYKLQKGDVVAVMLNNSPEMIAIILGLSQMGVIASLINVNLRSHGLAHCINISQCTSLLVDAEFIDAIEEVKKDIRKDITMYQLRDEPIGAGYHKFEEELFKEIDDPPELVVKPSHDDSVVYIYTSGTSGLPKAAVLPHSKFLVMSLCSMTMLGVTKKDKIYNPLPHYHTSGLIIGVGPSITSGIPVVVTKKFSSYTYFPDCKKYNCTIGQYIGEMGRYIIMTPPSASDKDHNVKRLLGNGMNVKIWKTMADRFNVKICELYGSTEGNCNMINFDGRIGSVGFLPALVPFFLYPYYLIEVDLETLEPVRDSDDMCVMCDYGEPGMLVGRIKDTPDRKFHGYVSNESGASASKVIHDVFQKGDQAFVTGDILVVDEFLYFYFMDRTGDTFRWKGENVSTVEVEAIGGYITHQICACYGVKLNGFDGYAGMMAIEDPNGTVDLKELLAQFINHLPKYSIPRFIRIVNKIPMTSTHKIIKRYLTQEGLNLKGIEDKVYYLDTKTVSYIPLTQKIIEEIEDFKIPM